MSKKMMKRSLALGALMAFVITGSAMAAETTSLDGVDASFSPTGIYTGAVDAKLKEVEVIGTGKETVTFIGNPEITTDTYFVRAWSTTGSSASATLSNINTLQADGAAGEWGNLGFYAVGDNAKVTLEQIGNIIVKNVSNSNVFYSMGNGASVEVNAVNINIDGVRTGVFAEGGSVTINTTEGFTATNLSKYGVIAYGTDGESGKKGNVAIESDGDVNISADMVGIYTYGGQENNVVINSDKEVTVAGGDYAILTESAKSEIGINADSVGVTGNIMSSDGSVVGLNSVNDMIIDGAITTGDDATTKLSFNNLDWNVTGESNVTEIDGDVANIKVSEIKENLVTIDEKGNDTQLTVTTSSDNFEGSAEEGMVALANVVTSNGEALADKLVATAGAMYDEVTADIVGGKVQNVQKEIAAANVSVNEMAAIGLMSWRAEMNDMNKRMGELRNANGEHGVWVRMVRGESEYGSVKNQYNQYQLGYDEKLSVDKRWTVGAAISYTDAENSFAQGSGESTNKALSIYGSKLNADGTFVDLIAKYARLENEFDIVSGMGDADYSTNGYSFSAEFGKRIQQGKGLWIEPQVELTYGKVSAVDYVTANGVNVAQDGMESLVGRVGFSLGKDVKGGNVYARASYLYDFEGETQATLDNDAVLKQDLGGGWWEVGVGANINLSKATYIYADVEKTFGGEVDTNWQWNLGVRYSF